MSWIVFRRRACDPRCCTLVRNAGQAKRCRREADGGNSDFGLICGQIVARLVGLVGVGDDDGGQVDS
jgi:hypothetical protein